MRQRGFTMIELLTVVTIAAIMMGIALPSFKNFVAGQQVKTTSYDISTSLLLARSEAIKRDANVTIAPSQPNNWMAGWSVTTVQSSNTITLQNQPAIADISIGKAPASITFQSTGRPSVASVSYWEIAGTQSTRCVRLDPAGIASTSTVACP